MENVMNKNVMNTNRTKLALRRQSIRTLTPNELSIAHGGSAGGDETGHGPTKHTSAHTFGSGRTKTKLG